MNGVTIIVLFLILLATGLPVAYVMYATAGIYFLSIGLNMSVMIQKMGSSMNSITMVAIPMFIFAGTLMNNVNLTDSLFHSIEITPIGKMRGGLAQVNVIASLVFAGMSGAALADIGGLGKIEIKAMENAGYSIEDATGITLASSAIGPIFPPSVPLMLYALYAEQSGITMLMAGVVPALILTVCMMAVVGYPARRFQTSHKDFPERNPRILRSSHSSRWNVQWLLCSIRACQPCSSECSHYWCNLLQRCQLESSCKHSERKCLQYCFHDVHLWKCYLIRTGYQSLRYPRNGSGCCIETY